MPLRLQYVIVPSAVVLMVISTVSCKTEMPSDGKINFTDDFARKTNAWKLIGFEDNKGTFVIQDGEAKLVSGKGLFGIFHKNSITGHFVVEAEFGRDENIGLAVFQENEGEPDLENYTMLCVDSESGGYVSVYLNDIQNGKRNVLDNTGDYNKMLERRKRRQAARERDDEEEDDDEEVRSLEFNEDGFKHVLTGSAYSMPFTSTNKKIKILRDSNSGFFHFYYGVKATIRGIEREDWMELRPSRDWAPEGTNYFIGLVSLHGGDAVFNKISVRNTPSEDRNDIQTGFKITEREYNWSGFMGDALVVTFDDKFAHHDRDIKFVFWSEMNYVPAWHLNNQLLYTYEFVETWGGGNAGCHEPMSDRLRVWSRVEVMEDNPVRKIIRWHYVLCDPDYKVPENDTGEQLPEVDEYWTFYPDGSGTRHIIYTPKLDSEHRQRHELGELISVAGSRQNSSDFYASPALTMLNLEGDQKEAHPGPKFDYFSDMDDWDQQILVVHFKEEPDVFCSWSHDEAIPETFSGYKIRYENAWQGPDGKGVHWPVNKRPYTHAFSAGGLWKAEVSHSCLLSWGIIEGYDWEDHYQLSNEGRKFREWVSLVGINEPNGYEHLKQLTRSWLFDGEVHVLSGNLKYVKADYKRKSLVFDMQKQGEAKIELAVGQSDGVLINPVIEIRNWGERKADQVMVNGVPLENNQFKTAIVNGNSLLVWSHITSGYKTEISIR